MKRLSIVPPFLFALFPILSLYASNVRLVQPRELVVPSIAAIAVSALLLLVANALLRDLDGAAILVCTVWVLIILYRVALRTLGGVGRGGEYLLLVAFLVLLSGIALAVRRWRGQLRELVQVVAIMGIALVAMPIAKAAPALLSRQLQPVARTQNAALGGAEVRLPTVTPAETEEKATLPTVTPTEPATESAEALMLAAAPAAPEETPTPTVIPTPTASLAEVEKPDIYYIILDGYARQDVLQELYGYDNTAFLQALEDRGFYVATRSRANYCQTYLSLASSLNGTYLDALAAGALAEGDDRRPLQDMIRQNAVVNYLRNQGYTYVACSTGYTDAEMQSADVYVAAPRSLSQFTSGLMNTTPISPVIALQYDLHRQRLLYAFDHLPDAATMDGPTFTFAHICAPHPPFVFAEDGTPITPNREFSLSDGSHYMSGPDRAETADYLERYRGQLAFVSQRILQTVDAILAASPTPPIIILQADHGPGAYLYWETPQKTNMKERLSILNAYYVPPEIRAQLYEEITPVNTFRILFNALFGTDYELAPDVSYFSTWNHPYRFIPVSPEGTPQP